MNQDQVLSALRSVLIAVTSFAVAKGWISSDIAANVVAAFVPLALAIWGILDKSDTKTVAKAANVVQIAPAQLASVGLDPIKPKE